LQQQTHQNYLFNLKAHVFAALFCLLVGAGFQARAQSALGAYDRDSARTMLEEVKSDLKSHYYDQSYRGMDLDTRFKAAEEKIKQATTRDQLLITVAQVLLDLNDSHTFFLPPGRSARVEYGWQMQMIGETCYVTAVKPKSDAETKGLKTGDAILSVDGFRPTRQSLWKMYYRYYALMPARGVRLVVQSPGDAQSRQVDIQSKIEQGAAVTTYQNLYMDYLREEGDTNHDRLYESGNDLLIWKMPTFVVSKDHVDDIMSRAKKFKSLIIDLRGNGGGYVETLNRLAGYFFDHDVKIADLKGRKQMKPQIAKTRGADYYKGQFVVLVDSDSGSASELFARVMQLEKRGAVIGDRSAGAVMTSEQFGHETGVGRVLYYGTSVTIADMLMTDGKSLEETGVTPDEVMLLTGADLAAKRDPVLSHAAETLGVKLDAEKAGALFPFEWR
jgi:C-terminal processing protease CtpA/Prc